MNHRFGRASRWTLAAGMAAGLLLAVPVTGLAADVPDQTNAPGTIPNRAISNKVMAQTFTASMSGQIDKVSLALESHSNLVTGWLEIRTITPSDPTGQPNGGTLWPTTLTPIQFTQPFGNPLHSFTISPFQVTAGTTYAIVWTAKIGTAYWWGNDYSSYDGGQEWLSCQGCAWSANPTKDLAFQTWVGTAAANQPPAVAADHSSVSANEGAAGANTGTFSNFGTNAVNISASAGSITKTGTSSGSWSWRAPDEATSRTITVTADDGHGFNATANFTATVNGAAPTASATGPASDPEGTAVSVTGTATSPSADDNATIGYGWVVTKDGGPYASGGGTHWHFTPNDEGTYVATVTATDDGSQHGSASTTVNVTNVAPTATIISAGTTTSLVVTPEMTLGFTGTFTDPGTADTHTFLWAFGDGATSSAQNPTHFYGGAGIYPVTLTVKDDDGASDTARATVVVQSPQQALGTITSTVNGISTLNKGQKNSLDAKLAAAAAAAARGDNTASHNQMSAFLSEVRADVKTGKISAGDAATLTDAIHAVEAALGTYNRMLQWWPLEP